MRNNLLAGGLIPPAGVEQLDRLFEELGIDPGIRSERLSPQELLRFSRRLHSELEDL
jgi:hypothetical protein